MRHRLAGLAAATAIAAAALVGCSPPHEQPSTTKVTDQKNEITTFEAPAQSTSPSGEMSPSDEATPAGATTPSGAATAPAGGEGHSS